MPYDRSLFVPELLEANMVARDAETLHHPRTCGLCVDCLVLPPRRSEDELERPTLGPLAIADKLELSLSTVTRYLGELEDAGEIDHVPSFLTGAPR
jgi:winged helix-turn-helix DNA-binding protein